LAYDAFISYSHSADGKLAPALQHALHRFAKPLWKLRAVNVFRDGTSLAAAHDLSGAIKDALADSRFFIFLASPGSAQSKWCQRELEFCVAERPP
jgi:TIR domain